MEETIPEAMPYLSPVFDRMPNGEVFFGLMVAEADPCNSFSVTILPSKAEDAISLKVQKGGVVVQCWLNRRAGQLLADALDRAEEELAFEGGFDH